MSIGGAQDTSIADVDAAEIVSPGRAVGATNVAMLEAPIGAVFIWARNELAYPRKLASKLSREDLEIVGHEWLANRRWTVGDINDIVVDPAVELSADELTSLLNAQIRVRFSQL